MIAFCTMVDRYLSSLKADVCCHHLQLWMIGMVASLLWLFLHSTEIAFGGRQRRLWWCLSLACWRGFSLKEKKKTSKFVVMNYAMLKQDINWLRRRHPHTTKENGPIFRAMWSLNSQWKTALYQNMSCQTNMKHGKSSLMFLELPKTNPNLIPFILSRTL